MNQNERKTALSAVHSTGPCARGTRSAPARTADGNGLRFVRAPSRLNAVATFTEDSVGSFAKRPNRRNRSSGVSAANSTLLMAGADMRRWARGLPEDVRLEEPAQERRSRTKRKGPSCARWEWGQANTDDNQKVMQEGQTRRPGRRDGRKGRRNGRNV